MGREGQLEKPGNRAQLKTAMEGTRKEEEKGENEEKGGKSKS